MSRIEQIINEIEEYIESSEDLQASFQYKDSCK